ncbi:MAG: GH3 auxin-responsive promoter family protein, partial [Bacteroidota bacterium]
MGLKAALSVPYARFIQRRIQRWNRQPLKAQQRVFDRLIAGARNTAFGRDHGFDQIRNYADFQERVPVRDYEGLKHYVERIIGGERDVLWPGLPLYFCKTSGTTSGTKFIPLTKVSMGNHIRGARNALLSYIAETGNAGFVNGKMIFLQGSPELEHKGKVPYGRLSGIVAHHVPNYLQRNRMPSWETNCIEDWETKVDAVVQETLAENMALISGIPSWVQMYFERLLEASGKSTIAEVFPEFSLFVYGGVSFAPYRATFDQLIGKTVDSIEVYPASEGFIARDVSAPEGRLEVLALSLTKTPD